MSFAALDKFLFFGGAGGAHAGGGPILGLITDVEALELTVLPDPKPPRGSPISPYNCLGISSGGLKEFMKIFIDSRP